MHQGGLELLVGIDGKELDGRILYALGPSALLPFINNDDEERSVGRLTRVELPAALGPGCAANRVRRALSSELAV